MNRTLKSVLVLTRKVQTSNIDHYIVHVPIYNVDVVVAFADTIEEAVTALDIDSKEMDEAKYFSDALTIPITTPAEERIFVAMFKRKAVDEDTIAHEANHLGHFIFEYIGQETNSEGGGSEALIYFQTFLTKTIRKIAINLGIYKL